MLHALNVACLEKRNKIKDRVVRDVVIMHMPVKLGGG